MQKLSGADEATLRVLYKKHTKEMEDLRDLLNNEDLAGADGEVPDPTNRQLRLYFMANFVPFLGFGFFDNAIMLLCGDLIDSQLGAVFCFSTLAAAGMGNIVGDVSGIWLSGTIEYVSGKHIQDHMLTSTQMRLHKVQTLKTIAMTSGIFIGCVIGMFPIFWPKEWRLWGGKDGDGASQDNKDEDAAKVAEAK